MSERTELSPDWLDLERTHQLESEDPLEWLRYGVALLQLSELGPVRRQQQQQAALAFEQARRHGASAEAIRAACRHSLQFSLQEALQLADWPLNFQIEPLFVTQGPPVTLTVISGRLERLPLVLESLRRQTLKPVCVHLHLSEQAHLLDRGVNPDHPLLDELEHDPWVQLHWGPNLGPYRKIVPYLQACGYDSDPDVDLFITVDDDTIYPPRFVEYLCRNHERYDCIVAHRGRRIRPDTNQGFLPYAEWHDGLREPRLANLPTGQSGVLYRRSYFPDDLELEAALALAPTHDDLWLRWLTAREGVPAVILQPNAAARTQELAFPCADSAILEKQETLWFAYNSAATQNGNDKAAALVNRYFEARGYSLIQLLRREAEDLADLY